MKKLAILFTAATLFAITSCGEKKEEAAAEATVDTAAMTVDTAAMAAPMADSTATVDTAAHAATK
jgi:hypothetical protein